MTVYVLFMAFAVTVAVVAPLTLWAVDRLATAWERMAADFDRILAETDADFHGPAAAWGPAEIAADTWARHEAEQRLRDWQAHVAGAFEAAMGGREPSPIFDQMAAERLRAQLDDDEAVGRWLS